MKISFVGTGNITWHLAGRLKICGHEISQIYGRTPSKAEEFATIFDAKAVHKIENLKAADIIFICVNDVAIQEVVKDLSSTQIENSIISHTSGTVPSSTLKKGNNNYGVFYPLQTFTAGIPVEWSGLPVLITASDEETQEKLKFLALDLGSKVVLADDNYRKKMHLSAVTVNNFANHLYTLTQEYCESESLDFNLLLPLIEETTRKIKTIHGRNAQTGPAKRNDRITIQRHLELLKEHPGLRMLYEQMTESIQKIYNK